MNSDTVCDLVGCSYRQLSYWAGRGFLGEHQQRLGSGARRDWSGRDCEIAWAVARSAEIGTADFNRIGGAAEVHAWVAAAVRARPVGPEGEWLVVTADGTAQRFDRLLLDDLTAFDAARVIRLRSFSSGVTEEASPPASPAAVTPGGLAPPTRNANLVGVCQSKQSATLTARAHSPAVVCEVADGFAVWALGATA